MLIHPTISAEFKTSPNLHHDKGVFVPMDDAPFFIVFPVNPNWLPESVGPGWIIEGRSDAPGVLDITLRDMVVRSPGDSGRGSFEERTRLAFKAPVGEEFSLNIEDSFSIRQIVVEGGGMADSPVTIDIRLVRGVDATVYSMTTSDYPREYCLWRRFEREILPGSSSNRILFRMRAEYCSDGDLAAALIEAEALESKGCRIFNHPSGFRIHNPKETTFKAWSTAGIPHPAWEYLDMSDVEGQIRRMAGRTGACLIRLNDLASGRGIKCVLAGVSCDVILKDVGAIITEFEQRVVGHSWCRIIVVEKIQPEEGRLWHFRSFISNKTPFCTCVMLTRANPEHCSALGHDSVENTIQAQTAAEDQHRRYCDLISKACVSAGLDCGAVDWLAWPDREPVFLEVNGYWGMGSGLLWPYDNTIRQALIDAVERNPKKFPSLSLRLDEWEFWKRFYSLLDADSGSAAFTPPPPR